MVEQRYVPEVARQESVPVKQVSASMVTPDLLVVLKDKAKLHGCKANDNMEAMSSLDVVSVSDHVQESRLPREASKGVANLMQSLKQAKKSAKKGKKKGKKGTPAILQNSSP
ncbi:hypothetical protein V6N12_066702 [Hibiscus sabdariffa]|uniref:Uncharacterized protein n=1 Tax=Hibiscus sabdariffa TaxID=183260 RepID=A0ABR2BDH2_9ROSI